MSTDGKEVVEWLLGDDNPSVKYWTLRNLLGHREDGAPVIVARQQIMREGPVPKILARLNGMGHYTDPATIQKYGAEWASYGYLPKYRATTWQLILFADLGADGSDARVHQTCEYVLERCCQADGLFSIVGNQFLAPCFQGNMLYALTALGYADDPRVVKAWDVLLTYARFDDGGFVTPKTWPYRGRKDRCFGAHSCYAGCLKALRAVSALPRGRWNPRLREFVARGAEYFLKHRVFKSSHARTQMLHKGVDQIAFPNFVYGDFLEILTTLLALGVKDARMQDAIDLLEAKQLPNGRWRLERDVPAMHAPLDKKNRESKWATYRARYALKMWEQ